MGLGVYPESDPLALDMLGMHGAVYANYAIDSADLLLAFGVRFDDRVTGKLESFAARASIVHIDIDPAEIGKNKDAHCSIFGSVKPALKTLNGLVKTQKPELDFSEWRGSIEAGWCELKPVLKAPETFSFSSYSSSTLILLLLIHPHTAPPHPSPRPPPLPLLPPPPPPLMR
jgi:thiamine pyrophosphate-dependent acetolactate synthase large subunit-like protein